MSGSVLFPLLRQQSKCFFFCAICIFPKMFYSFYGILRYNITGCFPENIRSTLWFSYDHTSGQILFKSAAILPYKITKFRLFFDAVLNPPYWYFSRFSDSNQNVSFFAQFAFFRKCFIHFTEFCGIISLDAFPKNIRSTLWFSYDHTSGQILFKSAAILPYKITKFRLFFDAVLNPPYWNVNKICFNRSPLASLVLNPPYWNVNNTWQPPKSR